ncbi:uncharacterized protein EV420DRAFT_1650785 [Desarmillaria tabescens]|uniref:Uncharacterized protein n=1 Tax=Armillaria tabescens TaxID=1929756 RepID=A0AA39JD21_ARMTA|nr:uncharacterized protein EV420DRAFT_1650785 [Desarmillaria tabescens]KAK0439740.1 hypothetical protein EV420DRAFT_1650785 [Desarmillaria tabescens]
MDRFYDMSAASRALENTVQQRQAHNDRIFMHDIVTNDLQDALDIHVNELDRPQEWCLFHNDDDAECEFVMQGIVCLTDLLPFKKRVKQVYDLSYIRISHTIHREHQAPYLRQSDAVTGFGTNTFKQSIKAMACIVAMFSQDIGYARLNNVKFTSTYQSYPTIHLSNRYFSRRDQVLQRDEIEFDQNIDPFGLLSKMGGQKYCHAKENAVYYYENTSDSDGSLKYVDIKPSKIQVGDIVEVTFGFVAFPLSKGRVKITAMLRSITLLDGTFTEESAAGRVLANIMPRLSVKHGRKYLQEIELAEDRNEEIMDGSNDSLDQMTVEANSSRDGDQ